MTSDDVPPAYWDYAGVIQTQTSTHTHTIHVKHTGRRTYCIVLIDAAHVVGVESGGGGRAGDPQRRV
jgi:hypothetical protein